MWQDRKFIDCIPCTFNKHRECGLLLVVFRARHMINDADSDAEYSIFTASVGVLCFDGGRYKKNEDISSCEGICKRLERCFKKWLRECSYNIYSLKCHLCWLSVHWRVIKFDYRPKVSGLNKSRIIYIGQRLQNMLADLRGGPYWLSNCIHALLTKRPVKAILCEWVAQRVYSGS